MDEQKPLTDEELAFIEDLVAAPTTHREAEELLTRAQRLVADVRRLRALFKKYVEVVNFNEGVDFLYPQDWTPKEWEAIRALIEDLPEHADHASPAAPPGTDEVS